jgi:hypothetical protein
MATMPMLNPAEPAHLPEDLEEGSKGLLAISVAAPMSKRSLSSRQRARLLSKRSIKG